MRRLVFALLFLALPLPAAAQPRTLCSSPTMDYCLNIYTWNVWVDYFEDEWNEGGILSRVDQEAVVQTFGSAAGNWWVGTWSWYQGLSLRGGFHSDGTLSTLGDRTWSAGVVPIVPATTADLEHVVFLGADGSRAMCFTSNWYPDQDAPRCYEPVGVPEPGSLLLLATGIGGVVIVGRRRRGA